MTLPPSSPSSAPLSLARAGYPLLDALWARGRAFLGTDLAILGGAMTWVSERHLVSALSNAGAFGVLAAAALSPSALATEIEETRALTAKPFGVNLITLHPKLLELVEVCRAGKVSHIIFAGGIPPAEALKAAKDAGAKILCFAPALALAKKLIKQGADALVIEGSEAGGHIGPVSLSVLAQEILPNVREVPVFVAGGIGHGLAVASYLEQGAAGVQLGTRFVCANECIAHPKFKEAFLRAAARDALPSVQLDPRLPVIPVRALQNAGTKAFMEKQREVLKELEAGQLEPAAAQLAIEHFWAGALRRAVIDGDVENGSLMAGQSVGMVKRIAPAREILQELAGEAEAALAARAASRIDAGKEMGAEPAAVGITGAGKIGAA